MSVPKGARSPIWKLVVIDPSNHDYAICMVNGCNLPISRGGKKGAKFCTTNIMNHLVKAHPDELGAVKEKMAEESALKGTKKISTHFKYDKQNPCMKPSLVGASSSSSKLPLNQPTIQEGFVKYWDINDSSAKNLTYKILEMIVMDNQPFDIVNDIGFARLMAHCKPKYKIPSRSYFTETVLPRCYLAVQNCVKDVINDVVAISLTTDNWVALNKDQFISLTGHCVFENFDQQALVLHTKPFHQDHTALNICAMVEDMIQEFAIPKHKIHQIVHDNASNIVCAIDKTSEFESLPCFIHTTQLVIDDSIFKQATVNNILTKCRSLGSHFSRSPKAYQDLKKNSKKIAQKRTKIHS